ncbi:MAG: hypothetical protein HQL70_03340 [Magnetococcales bacterium]|nr:hypothetical protein [Magnetococcales bacterium]
MKGLVMKIGAHGRKVLLIGLLTSGLAACGGHRIDPTQSRMPTYEMPTAIIMQTPAVRLQGYGTGGMPMAAVPQPHYAPAGHTQMNRTAQPAFGIPNTMVAPNSGYVAAPSSGDPRTMVRSDGATVVQQPPVTVNRPSIVIPQDPIWVGNPPRPIPQPPVVVEQPPIVYDQPSVVVRPPQVEFTPPARPVMMPNPVLMPAPQQSYYPQMSQYQRQTPSAMAAPVKQHRRLMTPAAVMPSQPGPEDYLPPK